jgi:hypothetical protein
MRNALRCEAIAVNKSLQPPDEEIRGWMKNWTEWEEEYPDWFEQNREQILVNVNIKALGGDWVRENFWESGNTFLKFQAACVQKDVRPDIQDIIKWIEEVDRDIGDKSRVAGAHLPNWWNRRGEMLMINGIEPPESWIEGGGTLF